MITDPANNPVHDLESVLKFEAIRVRPPECKPRAYRNSGNCQARRIRPPAPEWRDDGCKTARPMSAESHRRYLERSALREAQKAIDRRGRAAFGKADFAGLRIQTVEPWKRILLASLGVLAGAGGYFVLTDKIGWVSFVLFALGVFLLLAAWLGVRKTVKAALDGVDPFQLFDALF